MKKPATKARGSKTKIKKKTTSKSNGNTPKKALFPSKYEHLSIEKKWQKTWAKLNFNVVKERPGSKKFYALIEFPYPSGDGLHVGHVRSNTAMDIICRKRRREGYNVLYPIGWDAFGLPTENYAIKTGIHPIKVTKKNTDTFRRQLKDLGFSFDWTREVDTTDPKYYKWTQWLFLKFFERGLAYKKKMNINWCPVDLIGLANEEVINGKCERCGATVEKKEKEQWMLAITKYADRLLSDLDAIDTSKLPHIIDKKWPPRPGKKVVERRTIHAIVKDPKTGKYLGLQWKKYPWVTFIVGGVEDGEDIIEAAKREVIEETGYTDIVFKQILGAPVKAEYFAAHKDQNRIAITSAVLFELKSDSQLEISDHEKESHDYIWMDPKDMNAEVMTCAELPVWLERLKDPSKYTDGSVPFLLDWPERIKAPQRNWIGKSEGATINFEIFKDGADLNGNNIVDVYTTRPDTLFGVTYIVLAPEHPYVKTLLSLVPNKDDVSKYVIHSKTISDIERTDATKEKTGVKLEGVYAINPANKQKVPVWVANYVLADYGTGAVMAVPAHDERDWLFAKKQNLEIKQVIKPIDASADFDINKKAYTESGILINSESFNGKDSESQKKEITKYVGGQWTTKYKLRDWIFSRQHYWGEPIPVVHCQKCGIVPVPEKNLPVELPNVKNYKPTQTGESPLASISKWVNTKCPKCKGPAKRETDTMPNWAGSSWYYLRYTDPKNSKKFADSKRLAYWTPVDWYNGGMEHTTLHLLYSRFWHKFFFDLGLVPTAEPYKKRTSHGLILAEGGVKMSKSKGNVINPDEIVKSLGADTLRVYEMFMGPFEQAIAWDTNNIAGSRRFIEKIWKLGEKVEVRARPPLVGGTDIHRIIHKTIHKVSDDIENMRFNTAISSLMIAVNELEKHEKIPRESYETILQLFAPFAPHVTEELWAKLGNKKSIHLSPWPSFDPALASESEVKIIIQVNGKLRGSFSTASGTDQKSLEETAKGLPDIQKWLENSTVVKVIVVPNKLVNIVTKPA